jgi:hypothetical protein
VSCHPLVGIHGNACRGSERLIRLDSVNVRQTERFAGSHARAAICGVDQVLETNGNLLAALHEHLLNSCKPCRFYGASEQIQQIRTRYPLPVNAVRAERAVIKAFPREVVRGWREDKRSTTFWRYVRLGRIALRHGVESVDCVVQLIVVGDQGFVEKPVLAGFLSYGCSAASNSNTSN